MLSCQSLAGRWGARGACALVGEITSEPSSGYEVL